MDIESLDIRSNSEYWLDVEGKTLKPFDQVLVISYIYDADKIITHEGLFAGAFPFICASTADELEASNFKNLRQAKIPLVTYVDNSFCIKDRERASWIPDNIHCAESFGKDTEMKYKLKHLDRPSSSFEYWNECTQGVKNVFSRFVKKDKFIEVARKPAETSDQAFIYNSSGFYSDSPIDDFVTSEDERTLHCSKNKLMTSKLVLPKGCFGIYLEYKPGFANFLMTGYKKISYSRQYIHKTFEKFIGKTMEDLW